VNDPVHIDSDELSRTAGLLVESLKGEENPKFQNSAFIGFMRQIRDKEMVVDGDNIVASPEATMTMSTTAPATRLASSTIGTTSNAIPVTRERSMTMDGWPMKSVHFDPVTTTNEPMVEASQGESEEDAYWKAENSDYREYWEKAASLSASENIPPRLMETPQQREWGALQDSWDAWEVTATGVKHTTAATYPFQANNPYAFGSRSGTRSIRSLNELEQVSAYESLSSE
jgi:peroxin-5